MEQSREILLSNLKFVQRSVYEINELSAKLVSMEAQYRGYQENITTNTVADKANIFWKAFIRANAYIYIVLGILCSLVTRGFRFEFLMPAAVIMYIYVKYIKKQTEVKLIWKVVFAAMLISPVFGSVIFFVVDVIIWAIVGSLEWFVFIPRKNKQIDEANEEVKAYNRDIKNRANNIKETMRQKTEELGRKSSDWYPKDYYFRAATDFFVSAMENQKADTMKELVNLYDATQEKKQMMEYQRTQAQKLNQLADTANQMHYDNQMIQAQLMFSNVMTAYNTYKMWF